MIYGKLNCMIEIWKILIKISYNKDKKKKLKLVRGNKSILDL